MQKLMHPDRCFIYISFHHTAAFCIQMSLNVFHSPLCSPHLSILQIQLIFLLIPAGLDQYAWLNVTVINTWVLFQEIFSWFVPQSRHPWTANMVGNQQNSLWLSWWWEIYTCSTGGWGAHLWSWYYDTGTTDKNWGGYELEGDVSLSIPVSSRIQGVTFFCTDENNKIHWILSSPLIQFAPD